MRVYELYLGSQRSRYALLRASLMFTMVKGILIQTRAGNETCEACHGNKREGSRRSKRSRPRRSSRRCTASWPCDDGNRTTRPRSDHVWLYRNQTLSTALKFLRISQFGYRSTVFFRRRYRSHAINCTDTQTRAL